MELIAWRMVKGEQLERISSRDDIWFGCLRMWRSLPGWQIKNGVSKRIRTFKSPQVSLRKLGSSYDFLYRWCFKKWYQQSTGFVIWGVHMCKYFGFGRVKILLPPAKHLYMQVPHLNYPEDLNLEGSLEGAGQLLSYLSWTYLRHLYFSHHVIVLFWVVS